MTSRPAGGRLAAWGAPIAFALLAFVFRALSVADLANDHYMTLGWAQQVLFGEWPERDFVEPGMPLSYLSSAAVQYYWPGPFSELLLTAGLLAGAAGVTLAAAARLSGSWTIGLLAALVQLAFHPTFHSFHKVLTPVVAILLLQVYAQAPSRARLLWLGLWTVVAALFRHDLGLYAGLAVVVGLTVLHAREPRAIVRTVATAVAGGALLFLPYAAYVQWAVGWPEHLRRGAEFLKSDAHQLFVDLPAVADMAQWNRDGATAFLFFATHALLALATVTLIARRRRLTPAARGATAAAITALAAFLPVILRQPLDGRLTDLAGVFSLVFAWLLGQSLEVAREARATGRNGWAVVVAACAIVFTAGVGRSVWLLGAVGEQIDNTGIHAGWRGVSETWSDLRERGTVWPWARSWPTREMPQTVLYLRACTTPDDAVLLTWPAPEYNFFARRRFAAGHVGFLPPDAYTTAEDQRQMLERLARQSVPVILTNLEREAEFRRAYPQVAAYLAEHYEPFGEFTSYDGATVVLSSRTGLTPSRTWGPERWPCGLQ